jgi:hypothetical protein
VRGCGQLIVDQEWMHLEGKGRDNLVQWTNFMLYSELITPRYQTPIMKARQIKSPKIHDHPFLIAFYNHITPKYPVKNMKTPKSMKPPPPPPFPLLPLSVDVRCILSYVNVFDGAGSFFPISMRTSEPPNCSSTHISVSSSSRFRFFSAARSCALLQTASGPC